MMLTLPKDGFSSSISELRLVVGLHQFIATKAYEIRPEFMVNRPLKKSGRHGPFFMDLGPY